MCKKSSTFAARISTNANDLLLRMKKILIFAFALLACAMAFTSCGIKIDSPLVGSWNARGKLVVVNPTDGSNKSYDILRHLYFFDNGTFQYNEYFYDNNGYATSDGYITVGTWSVDGDKLTLHKQKTGTCHANMPTYDNSFTPVDELIKWRIDGHYLYLIRNYGTENEYEDSFYDGSRN